jgi:hypothetical protein
MAWALRYLAHAGDILKPRSGISRITDRGRKPLGEHPNSFGSRCCSVTRAVLPAASTRGRSAMHLDVLMESAPPLDPRTELFVTRAPAGWRPMNREDLVRQAGSWPTTAATPEGIAGLLTTSRDLFCLAAYTYELYVVASIWSLLAVEAGLRVLYDNNKATLDTLIDRAETDSLITPSGAQSLHAGRRLRNSLLHPREQAVWSPGMAAGTINATHREVAELFPDVA